MISRAFRHWRPIAALLPSLTLLLLTACTAPVILDHAETQPGAAMPSNQVAVAPTDNLTDGCVESYDASIDYFPHKATITAADGLTIDYFNHYKVVTVLNPYRDASEIFQYVLVQCGTPTPTGYDDAQVITVPVHRFISLSTTILPGLDQLGLLDRLVGVEEFDYVNTPPVRQRIDAGALVEVGSGGTLNVELILDQDPDLIMTFAYGSPDADVHPKLLEGGLRTAITAGYMETSPLGRAEWVKFTALFFNQEAEAETIFAQIATRYNTAAQLVSTLAERPTVLTGIHRSDAWRVSAGQSYFARFLRDAGADYLWADDESTGSIPLDFEAVYERAADADFWFPNTGQWRTLDDVAAADARYAEFAAFQKGTIFNNNARLNEFGGNDYFEKGVANPDLILLDLIAVFHPDLLPDHELEFFVRIHE